MVKYLMELSKLEPILNILNKNSIKAIIVGGSVRDFLMGLKSSKDIDIELYNLTSLDNLIEILKPFGKPQEVGKSFGVIKLFFNGFDIDFSLPRSESKVGAGHRGFDIKTYINIDFETASNRRDFTINSIGYDTITKEFLDPHGGINDIKNKTLRITNSKTFIDDPLRILRAMSFGARFEFSYSDELIELSTQMIEQNALSELAKERIFQEFKKLFLLSKKPSIGLEFLNKIKALEFFSPLDKMLDISLKSDPQINLWTHTMISLDYLTSLYGSDDKLNLIYALTILLLNIDATIYLEKLTDDKTIITEVIKLINHHHKLKQIYNASDYEILKLSTTINIYNLLLISKADFYGDNRDIDFLYERASALGVLKNAPKALLMGRNLIDMGMRPSMEFKTILEHLYDAQLRGYFNDYSSAKIYLKNYLRDKSL